MKTQGMPLINYILITEVLSSLLGLNNFLVLDPFCLDPDLDQAFFLDPDPNKIQIQRQINRSGSTEKVTKNFNCKQKSDFSISHNLNTPVFHCTFFLFLNQNKSV